MRQVEFPLSAVDLTAQAIIDATARTPPNVEKLANKV